MTNTVPQVPYTPPAIKSRQPIVAGAIQSSDFSPLSSAHFEK